MSLIKILLTILSIVEISNASSLRIVGGNETTIDKRPYQASLQYITMNTLVHYCGASIISTRFVLSAAHCNPFMNLNSFYVRVGSTTYNFGGRAHRVGSFIPHPKFNPTSADYDIAIVMLAMNDEIILGPDVAIIPLTDGFDPVVGSMATISGWGTTADQSGVLSLNLREADLPVYDEDFCKIEYPYLTPRHICLGGTPEGNLSPCGGDSGGPAVQDNVLFGVIIGTNNCDSPNMPSIYTRISAVREWITCVSEV